MNNIIENRIVQMVFDNKKFESGIAESVKSLGNLDKNLKNIDSNSKALSGLGSVFSGLGANVESLNSKFSAWGVAGIAAVENITNRIVNGLMGALSGVKAQLDSLTFDQVSAGFSKFEQKADAVATITAAVASQGKSIEDVDKAMERLNWFTDETSYNFTDMASNIGKFTANNIDLDVATEAMEGIATWAALSGQNAQSASRAMYNLSQAIGVGAVKLMDWKSIENANMATTEFKQTALDTAVALGTLTKSGEGMDAVYKTVAGHEFTLTQFNTQLSDAWFNSDVLLKTLNKYGGFTTGLNKLYDAISDFGYTTTDIVKEGGLLDQYSNKMLDMNKLSKDTGISADELEQHFKYLTDSEQELGRKAFLAGQEARTLTAALDATKDAASTMWMNIFEKMFGNVEKAKVIWTNFCGFLYDTLVEPLNDIYDEVAEFVDKGGMKQMLSGFKGLGKAIINIGNSIRGVFTGDLANLLLKMADALQGFGNRFASIIFRISSEEGGNGAIAKLVGSFKTLFSYITEIVEPIKKAFDAIFPRKTMKESAEAITNFADRFAEFVNKLKPSEETLSNIQKVFEAIFSVIKKVISIAKNLAASLSPLFDVFKSLAGFVINATSSIADFVLGLTVSESEAGGFKGFVQSIADSVQWLIDKLNGFSLSDTWQKFLGILQNIWQKVKDIFDKMKEVFSGLDFKTVLKDGLFASISVGFGVLLTKIIGLVDKIKKFKLKDSVKSITDAISEGIGKITELFGSKTNTAIAAIKEFAISIALLTASLLVLSVLSPEDIGRGLATMISMIAVLGGSLALLNAATKKMNGGKLMLAASALLILAAALTALAVAMAAFALVANLGKVWEGLGLMAASLASVLAIFGAFIKLVDDPVGMVAGAAAMLVLSAALLVLAAAMAAFALIAKNMESAWKGFGLMAATIAVVAAALGILASAVNPVELIAASAAMLAFSAAMVVLGGALAIFTALAASGEAGGGLGLMIISLVALTAALIALGAAGPMVLVGAAALLVASAAMIALAAAIAALSLAMPLLALGLTALGAGIAGAASGVADAFTSLTDSIAGAVVALGDAIAKVVQDIIASVGKGIGDGLSAIGDGITGLSEGITDFGVSIGDVGDGIARFGDGLRSLEGIKWLELALGIDKITDAIKKLNKNPVEIETTPLTTFVTKVEDTGNKLKNILNNLKNELGQLANSGASYVVSMATYGLGNLYSTFYSLGASVAQGFANGISTHSYLASSAASSMAQNAYYASRTYLNINSPSRIFMGLGESTVEGYAKGIDKNVGMAEKSAQSMAEGATKVAADAAAQISALMEMDTNPIITPVLDLSSIANGANQIDSILSTNKAYGLSTNIQTSMAQLQNGSYEQPLTATIDSNELARAIANSQGQSSVEVKVDFVGSLAQLARVLQPEIVAETRRRGPSFIN